MNTQLNINQCNCLLGYNDKLAPGQQCVLNHSGCHYSCLNCFGPEYNQCLACDIQRVLNDSTCYCLPSSYDQQESQNCEPCNLNCQTCYGSSINECQSCDQKLFLVLSHNQCVCQQGYFELLGVCNKCHYSCLSCSSTEQNKCIDCNTYDLRQWDNNFCKCKDGFVDIGNPLCEACPMDCGDCDSQLNCISCKISKHSLNGLGRCDCPLGYEKDKNEQCVDCQSIQGRNIVQCKYQNSNDGVWTYGENCDDGNIIPRDGCTQFNIDKGFQCDNILLQPSICYQCPTNCLKCYHSEIVQCQDCVDNYFKKENICYQCHDQNCQVCESYSQCVKCFNEIIPINGLCLLCEKGYEYKDRACRSICGDGILTKEEQCDDHNMYNNDGCNYQCQIEPGFICNPSCILEENVIKAKLIESGQKVNSVQIEILEYQFDIDQIDIKIEYLNQNEDYKFKTQLINQNKFEIQFTFTKSVKQFNIIHVYLPIKSQKRLLDYEIREFQFTPIESDYYDAQQVTQRQSIQNTQQQFYQSLAYIAPFTLIIGGTRNVQILFEKANWGLIINLPQIHEFDTDYKKQIPQRFQNKGVDGLIINNNQKVIIIILTIIICIYVSRRVHKYIQRYQNRNKQVISLLQNDLLRQSIADLQVQQIKSKQQIPKLSQINTQNKNNRLLKQLNFHLQRFYENRYLFMVQAMNTSILDIALATFINLKYQNYFNDSILFTSFIFCMLFMILTLKFFYLLYVISIAHNVLKQLKMYRALIQQLFEGLKQDKISRLYGFQAIFQKTLFIISIVVFYERPLSQTLVCSSILIGLLLISVYQFPFSSYKDILSQFIPDVSLTFILLLCCLLAADQQINYLTYQQRYNVGWVMLAIISLSIFIQLMFIIKETCQNLIDKLKWFKSLIKK